MNGSAASGLPLIRACPSASSMSSSEQPSTIEASVRISAASFSVAPFTAPRPVTANWLAYVPESPACEFQYVSCPGRTFTSSGVQPRMSATTCAAVVSWPCPCGTVPRVQERRLAEVVRPRVERGADPEAEQLPARLRVAPPLLEPVVADQLERDVEAAGVVAGVVDAAVRRLVRHLLALDVVPLPHLDRVEPELARDDVHDPLGQPEVLHARVAAIRRDRRLVRHDLCEVDADVPPPIAPRRNLRPDDAAERLVAREG